MKNKYYLRCHVGDIREESVLADWVEINGGVYTFITNNKFGVEDVAYYPIVNTVIYKIESLK
jgi:hypothetical protein